MVVVMNGNHPSAILLNFDERMLHEPGVSVALATALFRDDGLPLARAAKVAGLSIVEFMQHLSSLGIAVIQRTAGEANEDMETLDAWMTVEGEKFDQFVAMLDAPIKPNPGLARLMTAKAPWKKKPGRHEWRSS